MPRKVYLVFFILFISNSFLFAKNHEKFVAVATFLKGRPALLRAGYAISLATGEYLYGSDTLSVRAGEAVALMFRSGLIAHLRGPFRGFVSKIVGKKKWYSKLTGSYLRGHGIFYSDTMLRRMSAQSSSLSIIAPYNSCLLRMPVTFRWISSAAISKYKVSLFEEGIVRKRSAEIAKVTLDGKNSFVCKLRFKPGQPYAWQLKGLRGERWVRTKKVFFQLLKKGRVKRVLRRLRALKRMKRRYPTDMAPYIISAILLMKEKLYHRAMNEVYQAIVRNRRASFPYALRGRIYEEMGRKNLAAKDYLHARKLEKKREGLR